MLVSDVTLTKEQDQIVLGSVSAVVPPGACPFPFRSTPDADDRPILKHRPAPRCCSKSIHLHKWHVSSQSACFTYAFPHEISLLALHEEVDQVAFTDGTSTESRNGTTVVICNGSNRPKLVGLGDNTATVPDPPQ